jgi:hypothetical protein
LTSAKEVRSFGVAFRRRSAMTKPRLWEKLNLSQWGRVKAMADGLGFKVQRLKGDRRQLLMPNVEVDDPH